LKGWWPEIGLAGIGTLFIVITLGLTMLFDARRGAYEAVIEGLEKEKVELLRKNVDLEEQCLALNNSLEWWMGYAEGASQAREAAFRECDADRGE